LLIVTRITARGIIGVAALAGAVLLACMALSAQASAEVGVPAGTVQQAAANALFLQYAPPSPTPGIVCLVDSGVDPNPDTTPILAGSHALFSNTDTEDELATLNQPLPGGHPDVHGTYMAMIAAAPANGWGMVGLAPTSVRVYNLKALAAGQTTFGFAVYSEAISYCQELSSSIPIAVVDLSLVSDAQPTQSEREALNNSVLSANAHGLGVVSAVGDEDGPVQALDYQQGVLGVGASDANPANLGAMCPFTNRGVGLAVLAPGCGSQAEPGGIEVAFSDDGAPAWAEGTGEAATIVAATEASIRAYSPTLTYSQVQGCITSTLANEGNLDVAAAFDACGLGQIVSEGMAAYRAANVAPPTTPTSIGPGSPLALRGPPNGANASDQAKLTARWSSTAKAVRTSSYGAADRISGRLATSAGQPISGALLNVYATPDYQGAKAVPFAGVRTGPTGGWTLTLPKDISSSALRFAYRSHVDDTVPVATATLTLRVHAGIALRIAPHTASVGRQIFFSGTLHGSPIPRGGKQLVLEASSGGEWIQFDTIGTGAKGRYRASYRFKFPGPVTYEFRVISRHEADFPFLDGASNVVAVHER
jgi:hypothetical protein